MKCWSWQGCKFFRQVFALGIFVAIGAAIFTKLEKPTEPHKVSSQRLLERIRRNLSTNYGVNLTEEEFTRLVSQMVNARLMEGLPDWSFLESGDFLIQAFTTVGYGNITPRTKEGQGFFLVCALFGIPLNMLTLKTAGELVNAGLRKLIRKIEIKLNRDPERHGQLKLLILSSILLFLYTVCSTFVLSFSKNWTYLESVYATFVMVSTIGFGDYILTDSPEIYMPGSKAALLIITSTLQLLVGLTILMCFFDAFMGYMEYFHEVKRQCTVEVIENMQARHYDSKHKKEERRLSRR